jgi:hypothetical protein
MSGGRLLHPQPKDAACSGDRDPYNMGLNNGMYIFRLVSLFIYLIDPPQRDHAMGWTIWVQFLGGAVMGYFLYAIASSPPLWPI